MARNIDKIQAFKNLLMQQNLEGLEELQTQLGDDDERNAEAIEKWLKADGRESLRTTYLKELNTLSPVNPLLGATGEKGIGNSFRVVD